MIEHPDWSDVPMQWFICDACDGSGVLGRTVTVYEHGCAWSHQDTEEWPCSECKGEGGYLAEMEPDQIAYDPTTQPFDEPFRHVEKPTVAAPNREISKQDIEILKAVRDAYRHDHNIVTVFEIVDRVISPQTRTEK